MLGIVGAAWAIAVVAAVPGGLSAIVPDLAAIDLHLPVELSLADDSRAADSRPADSRPAELNPFSPMTAAPEATAPLTYPPSPQGDRADDYHGTVVPDPYRWLEDPNSDRVQDWIAAQNQLTFGYLESLPQREPLRQRLTELWDYEKYGVPFKEGDRYFYFKNDGLQNQNVLYVLETLDGEPRVLLDPNQLSEDGTVALSGLAVSPDGRYLAYGLSASGSDWQEWRVRDAASGEDLPDLLKWIKFSGASWTADGQGFYYSRFDEPDESTQFESVNQFQKLYYHRLGDRQEADQLVYHRPDQPEWGFSGAVTDDGRYLLVTVWKGTAPENLLFFQDLSDPNGEMTELVGEFEASYSPIDNDGSLLWVQTDADAPRGRVLAVDLAQPQRDRWQEVVPESDDTLEGVSVLADRFVAQYLQDARSRVRLFALDGAPLGDIDLPGIGSVGGFGGKRGDRETFYAFTGFFTPTTIYRYDFASGESRVFREPQVDFDPNDYETRQVFYPSRDGTQIPMFVSHKKGLKLDGRNPTLLYGYGGFGVSLTPSFSLSNLVWMERGGVYAVPNLRGGGEYGETWHQAGTKANKQNVFDDFIAAAEWLHAKGYASPSTLAISGGSNGGLLVGACMTQRPDLFGAALPSVGVMDMLRFHKFTIGWAWTADYGSPDDPEEFKVLYNYSPLHNLKPGTAYPATLITTADRDDRVVPAHSFKFAAALQTAQAGNAPTLIRIETKAGHGAGKPTAKRIEEASDRLAFALANLHPTP